MAFDEPAPPSHRREQRRRTAVIVALTVLAVSAGILSAVALQRSEGSSQAVAPPTLATTEPSAEPAPEPEPEPAPEPEPEAEAEPEAEPEPEPQPVAKTLDVMVLNATSITGLAARTSGTLGAAGWTVAGSGNARGTYPADTIYYPEGEYAQAELLAGDLGIGRLMPNLPQLPSDRLTVVLTSGR